MLEKICSPALLYLAFSMVQITIDLFQGQYEIQVVPNITNITYGRDVGYKIEQETFDKTITNISATKIRESMGLK